RAGALIAVLDHAAGDLAVAERQPVDPGAEGVAGLAPLACIPRHRAAGTRRRRVVVDAGVVAPARLRRRRESRLDEHARLDAAVAAALARGIRRRELGLARAVVAEI